jgi:phospholipid/cholesterol/gamma-HCH transport system ATP-binding protein
MASPTHPDSPIAVQGLWKSFGKQTVLAGLSFELEAGKVTCVLGRSGTGKSVLLKLLIGLEAPDAGSIHLEGQDISSASVKELNETRKKVGFLFQQSALYDSMTIEENVAFPLRRHTTLSDAERGERVHQLLGASEWTAISTRCLRTFREGCKSGWDWRARWRWSRPS